MSTMDYNGYRESQEAEWVAKEIAKQGSLANIALTPARDTGLREVVAAGAIADMLSLKTYLRRVGNLVNVIVFESSPGTAVAGNKTIYTLPVGFRVVGIANPATVIATSVVDESIAPIAASSLGTTSAGAGALILRVTNAKRHYANLTFVTNDAWPATLPGTAV